MDLLISKVDTLLEKIGLSINEKKTILIKDPTLDKLI
jgi:hypothetical protein